MPSLVLVPRVVHRSQTARAFIEPPRRHSSILPRRQPAHIAARRALSHVFSRARARPRPAPSLRGPSTSPRRLRAPWTSGGSDTSRGGSMPKRPLSVEPSRGVCFLVMIRRRRAPTPRAPHHAHEKDAHAASHRTRERRENTTRPRGRHTRREPQLAVCCVRRDPCFVRRTRTSSREKMR